MSTTFPQANSTSASADAQLSVGWAGGTERHILEVRDICIVIYFMAICRVVCVLGVRACVHRFVYVCAVNHELNLLAAIGPL